MSSLPTWSDDFTEPDPFLQPLWEETPDEVASPGQGVRPAPFTRPLPGWPPDAELPGLLAPLAHAQDALARLDARAEAASASVRTGLVARLAFREAAGWLAATHAWVHPHDLALREHALTGGFDAAVRGGVATRALPNTMANGFAGWEGGDDPLAPLRNEAGVAPALHLARLLRHLPRRHNPLLDAESAMTVLGPLGLGPAGDFDAERFARWRDNLTSFFSRARRRADAAASTPPPLPALLAAATAAQDWMEAGIVDQPSSAQALAIAALLLVRTETLRVIPLPVWSAWPAIGQPGFDGLPELRHGVAARLGGGDDKTWPGRFLHLVAESARAGLRELDRLLEAAHRGGALTASLDRRSRLAEALDAVLRSPALTPKALARQLRITPQAAARLLATLAEAGIVAEITGRKSFRAFAVMAILSPPVADHASPTN